MNAPILNLNPILYPILPDIRGIQYANVFGLLTIQVSRGQESARPRPHPLPIPGGHRVDHSANHWAAACNHLF